VPISVAWQDGTGTTGVVTFCEQDREGKTTRRAGEPETVSCVLHEFGHAWFGSYLMERYNREWLAPSMRRPWLDEGLADFVASLREPAFLERRAAWIEDKVKKGVAAPAFEEIATYDAFYEKGDVDVHYWISALFAAELLGRTTAHRRSSAGSSTPPGSRATSTARSQRRPGRTWAGSSRRSSAASGEEWRGGGARPRRATGPCAAWDARIQRKPRRSSSSIQLHANRRRRCARVRCGRRSSRARSARAARRRSRPACTTRERRRNRRSKAARERDGFANHGHVP
jgi:hypothetical protein